MRFNAEVPRPDGTFKKLKLISLDEHNLLRDELAFNIRKMKRLKKLSRIIAEPILLARKEKKTEAENIILEIYGIVGGFVR
jgi:hypothetical protein